MQGTAINLAWLKFLSVSWRKLRDIERGQITEVSPYVSIELEASSCRTTALTLCAVAHQLTANPTQVYGPIFFFLINSDSVAKNPPANAGDEGYKSSISGWGRSPREGNGNQPTHSSILTWKIPWTEEPRGLQSTGSQRGGHDWACTRFYFPATQYTYWLNNIRQRNRSRSCNTLARVGWGS